MLTKRHLRNFPNDGTRLCSPQLKCYTHPGGEAIRSQWVIAHRRWRGAATVAVHRPMHLRVSGAQVWRPLKYSIYIALVDEHEVVLLLPDGLGRPRATYSGSSSLAMVPNKMISRSPNSFQKFQQVARVTSAGRCPSAANERWLSLRR